MTSLMISYAKGVGEGFARVALFSHLKSMQILAFWGHVSLAEQPWDFPI